MGGEMKEMKETEEIKTTENQNYIYTTTTHKVPHCAADDEFESTPIGHTAYAPCSGIILTIVIGKYKLSDHPHLNTRALPRDNSAEYGHEKRNYDYTQALW